MANTTLTLETVNWLTDSVLEYNAELWKDISASFEDVKKQLGTYKSYATACKERLEKQRDYYCSGKLSFAIVRLLHKKYTMEDDASERCIVYGRVLHGKNALSPYNISEEDRRIYVEILVALALDNPRDGYTKEELHEKFSAVMADDYPAHEAKKVVVDICFHLKWQSNDANYLLLRIGNDGLCANDPTDMVDRFLLDVKEATMNSKVVLHEKLDDLLTGRNAQTRKNKKHPTDGQTTILFNELGRIIANAKGLSLDKQINEYVKVLKKNKTIFDGYSESARKKLIHILLLAAQNVGWKIHSAELHLASMIKSGDLTLRDYRDGCRMRKVHLSDYCNVVLHDSISLDREPDREKLYLAICSGYAKTEQDLFNSESIEFAYDITDDSLAYPAVGTDGKLYRISAKHLLAAMNGETPVTKTDILFALYLLFRSVSNQEDHYSVYRAFIETAKNVLEELYMPPFYHVHILEFTLSSAILSEQMQDIFEDITYALPPLEPVTGIKYKPKKTDSRVPPIFEEHRRIPHAYTNLWRRIESHAKYATVSSHLHIPELSDEELKDKSSLFQRVYEKHGELYNEMASIANRIYRIWKDTGFDHIKILFPEESSEVVVSPSREKEMDAEGENLYSIQNHVQDVRLSRIMTELLHGRDDNNAMLHAFYLPARGGRSISLAQLAGDFERELQLHDTWNRAYRRKAILAVILAMVLWKFGVSLGDIGDQYNAGGQTGRHPYEISFKGIPTIRLRHLDYMLLQTKQETLPENEEVEDNTTAQTETPESNVSLAECGTYSDEELAAMLEETSDTSFTEAEIARITKSVEKADELSAEILDSDAWMIANTKQLSPEEERIIITHLQSENPKIREKARNALVESNLRLVLYIARKIPKGDKFEKFSDGQLGLFRAAERFDPGRGVRFSTYAYHWIYRYIRNSVNKTRFPNLPASTIQQIYRIENQISKYEKENGAKPTIYDLEQILKISPDRIKLCLQYATGPVRLNSELDRDTDKSTERIDLLPDEDAAVEQHLLKRVVDTQISDGIKLLTSREIRFLQLRNGQLPDESGTHRGRSYGEIAQILGMIDKDGNPDILRSIHMHCNIQRKLSHPDYEELRILAE